MAEQEIAGITVLGVGERVSPAKRMPMLRDLYKKALAQQADVYHCHEPDSLAVALAVRKKLGRGSVIFDAHELYDETFVNGRKPTRLNSLASGSIRKLTEMMLPHADAIITVSPGLQRYYERFSSAPVTLIMNSSPVEHFAQWNAKPEVDGFEVWHEGKLEFQRSLKEILRALALLKDRLPVELHVLGGVNPVERDYFDEQTMALGLQETIKIQPFQPYQDACRALCAARISLVLPLGNTANLRHSLPNKFFNSMAAGACIVATDQPDLSEVVRKFDAGVVVKHGDVNELAEALEMLFRNPDRVRKFGNNGRRAIEEELGWHVMEERLVDLYRRLGAGTD